MNARIVMITLCAASLLFASSNVAAHKRRRMRPRPRPQPLVSLSIDAPGGHSLRKFNHRGQTFVLGEMGQRYNLRLVNNSNDRVEVVVAVDGRDVVSGQSRMLNRDRGYVLPAHGQVVIRGFRTSMSHVAAFRFTSPGDSFAGRHGRPQRVGIIQVAAFRERAKPKVIAKSSRVRKRRHLSPGRAAPPRAPSAEARRSNRRGRHADRDMAQRPNNLGTQFGEQVDSRVSETRFVRSRHNVPDMQLLFRYDDAAGLQARGLPVFRPKPPRHWRRRPVRQPVRQSRFAQPPPR